MSVIIPVLNGEKWIGRCLEALQGQRYPAHLVEILIVDNGSTDRTPDIVRSYGVRLLTCADSRSPYSARNMGLQEAAGEVIALTDADCVPTPEWLERGVRPIAEGEAELVAGEIRFLLGERPTSAELLDATINCEMRNTVERRGAAKTGNLIFHRDVVTGVGMFRPDIRSGGDIAWTRAATDAGFSLVYREEATVRKHPRRLGPLLRKHRRVGRGHVRLWREEGVGAMTVVVRSLGSFLPRQPWKYAALARQRGLGDVPRSDVKLWATGWAATVATGIGRVEALVRRGENGS